MNGTKRKNIAAINDQLQAIINTLNNYATDELNAVERMPYAVRVTAKGHANILAGAKMDNARHKLINVIDILKTV